MAVLRPLRSGEVLNERERIVPDSMGLRFLATAVFRWRTKRVREMEAFPPRCTDSTRALYVCPGLVGSHGESGHCSKTSSVPPVVRVEGPMVGV